MEYVVVGLLLWVAGALLLAAVGLHRALGVRGIVAWPLLVPLGAARLCYALLALPARLLYPGARHDAARSDPVAESLARAHAAQDEAREFYAAGLTSAALGSESFAAEWHAMACAYAEDAGRPEPDPLVRSRAWTPEMRDAERARAWRENNEAAGRRMSVPRFSSGGLISREE